MGKNKKKPCFYAFSVFLLQIIRFFTKSKREFRNSDFVNCLGFFFYFLQRRIFSEISKKKTSRNKKGLTHKKRKVRN